MPDGWARSARGGYFNGPTLGAVDGSVVGTMCAPVLGANVAFSGISSTLVSDGDLEWGFLLGTDTGTGNGQLLTALRTDEAVAPVPRPAGLPLLIGALAPLALMRRRG